MKIVSEFCAFNKIASFVVRFPQPAKKNPLANFGGFVKSLSYLKIRIMFTSTKSGAEIA